MPIPQRFRFRRQIEVDKLRSALESTGFPRFKMFFLVCLTGGAGFVASFCMLRTGVTSMAIRYPVAIGIAYLAFLFLLWLWLRTSAQDYTDFPDFSGSHHSGSSSTSCPVETPVISNDSEVLSETLGATAQAEEFVVPIVIIVAAAALLLSSMWIIYTAPTLFAELLVDGALSASLYRRLRGLETRHWLATAVRRTIWPFVITAIIFGVGGKVMQSYYPYAHSLGDAIRSHALQRHSRH